MQRTTFRYILNLAHLEAIRDVCKNLKQFLVVVKVQMNHTSVLGKLIYILASVYISRLRHRTMML